MTLYDLFSAFTFLGIQADCLHDLCMLNEHKFVYLPLSNDILYTTGF